MMSLTTLPPKMQGLEMPDEDGTSDKPWPASMDNGVVVGDGADPKDADARQNLPVAGVKGSVLRRCTATPRTSCGCRR